jgi:hypothetical protein
MKEEPFCYCCSCDSYDGNASYDPCCRNHGWYAVRPCETHNSPGAAGDDGIIPDSVEKTRLRMGWPEERVYGSIACG